MSGFDDNPFGEQTIDNPFADPSIQQVTRNTNAQLNVNDYNPFDNNETPNPRTAAYAQQTTPATLQPTQEPPVYTRTGQQAEARPHLNTEELQRRQEELERKEEELARREQEIHDQATYNVRRHNWPPLPEQCCFQPCFYQDIQVDIPLDFQKIVRQLYYLWIFHGIVMLLNIFGGIVMVDFTIMGLGVLYMILFTPFSYLCWFRPAYKAFRADSSFNFMVFFFIFFFQFVITTIQTIGIPGSGTLGIITALSLFGNNAWSVVKGILAIIIAIGYGCAACGDLLLITKIHRIYRSTGASMAKAQQEFTSGILRNQHVRNAASDVAAAAVQSQFSQNSQNANNSRY